jgi:S1-C subfamily serine protease
MKNRFTTVFPVLVALVVGLSSCAAVVPGSALLTGGRSEVANKAAVVEAQPIANVQPETNALPPVQGIVASDLQERLQQVYDQTSPSVVNIRVKMDMANSLSGIPGLPGIPGQPDEMPNLDQLPEQLKPLLPFLKPFLDQLTPPGGNDSEQSNPDSQQGNDGNASPESGNNDQPTLPEMNQALGSGFVWDTQGHIVTNNHVAGNATEIQVTFADGVTVPAELVGTDPDSDLAVIKVDPKGLDLNPVEVADSSDVKVGQFAVAIGNPFGLNGTMTFGIVSALGRSLPANGGIESMFSNAPSYSIPDIIQTDAPVNPGNSGGVLLDLDGRLIGVPTAIESSSGVSAGIGFAVPAAIVAKVVPELIRDGSFEHAYVGISGTTMSPELAEAMDLPANQRGALVTTVAESGPAAEAGLRASEDTVTIDGRDVQVGGDIILGIDGQPVQRFDDLVTYLARNGKVGQVVELRILRDGEEQRVKVTLGERPSPAARSETAQETQPVVPAPERQQPETASGGAWLGISGLTLNRELNNLLDLSARERGVLVVSVADGSPADDAGLVAGNRNAELNGEQIRVGGDVIVAVNDENVDSIEQLAELVRSQKPGDELSLIVLRDGAEETVTVTLGERPANP